MSIIRMKDDPKLDERYAGLYVLPEGQPCYYCSEVLTGPSIHWRAEQDLYLHPACVLELFLRLMRDVHELECKEGIGFDVVATDVAVRKVPTSEGRLRQMARKTPRH